MLGKKARVEVPFCQFHRSWRKQRYIAGLLLVFGFVPVLILLGALGVKSGVGAVIMVAMITAGAILLLRVSSSFAPVYIDESCAKFKGACEQFLLALPRGSGSAEE
jgi:heme A synthase